MDDPWQDPSEVAAAGGRGGAATRGGHRFGRQLVAHRCRVGGNPHSYGPQRAVSSVTATAVEVTLPETLSAMDDHGLIELSHLVMREVVELEMRFDLEGTWRGRSNRRARPSCTSST